jgi:hypothetical protein
VFVQFVKLGAHGCPGRVHHGELIITSVIVLRFRLLLIGKENNILLWRADDYGRLPFHSRFYLFFVILYASKSLYAQI